MKKVLFALCVVLALVGCKKNNNNEEGTVGDFSFNNGTNGELTLGKGSSEVISFKGAVYTDLTVTSSDESIVSVDNDNQALIGVAEGTATITAVSKKDASKKATLKVTVVDALKTYTFSSIYMMQSSEEWQGVSHFLVRPRRYRGTELPDAGDAKLTVDLTHEGDTADIQSWVGQMSESDFRGKWFYLYNTTDGDSVGLFMDSICSARMWMLSNAAYFDGEGSFQVAGNGMIFEFTDFYMQDIKYMYILGDRALTNDVTAEGKQYTLAGQEPGAYPGYVQCNPMDTANYLEFFTKALNGESVSQDDYPFYGMYDSKFMMYYSYTDSETGESGIGGLNLGYAEVGAGNEYGCNFYLASDETTGWFKASYYSIKAVLMDEWYNYGLATKYDDEQEGYVFVTPLQMGPSLSYTYEGGTYPTSKPAKNGVRRSERREMPVRIATYRKQMSVTNTIGATLRMILSTARK